MAAAAILCGFNPQSSAVACESQVGQRFAFDCVMAALEFDVLSRSVWRSNLCVLVGDVVVGLVFTP